MIFKIFIVVLLLTVVVSLGSALYHLVNNKGDSDKLVKSLTWRIGLSVGIFILLLIGQAIGLIQPHGL
ncbi:MAG: twin transmembrane helix small protein [endosymbiont of Galathealinum brachiosum]|uniref:Twin transmembrane helix small protein n=1 Tax=endosymbiont of Galathealinum brachiosum TaxID=2200906 RepID=A0A370DGY5_9GAMM|nr:MAG: twin transmembrane helix small protein [endosymbiont of Galathealinum brachiosum]